MNWTLVGLVLAALSGPAYYEARNALSPRTVVANDPTTGRETLRIACPNGVQVPDGMPCPTPNGSPQKISGRYIANSDEANNDFTIYAGNGTKPAVIISKTDGVVHFPAGIGTQSAKDWFATIYVDDDHDEPNETCKASTDVMTQTSIWKSGWIINCPTTHPYVLSGSCERRFTSMQIAQNSKIISSEPRLKLFPEELEEGKKTGWRCETLHTTEAACQAEQMRVWATCTSLPVVFPRSGE